jgi:3-hydroxybutyrate dehydrogenase
MPRRVLVTGAASGIGRAIAGRLAGDGHRVLAVDLHPDPDGPGVPFEADLASRQGNAAAVGAALEQFGGLDAVVANAGFQHVAPIEEFPEERWDSLLAVLLTSPFLLAKHAWQALGESGDGRFLAVASVHGLVASPYKAGYVAAKHGLLGLVKVLALEGAERGISVSALCPGYVRTPIVESQIEAQARATGVAPERVLEDVLLAPQAIKRLLEPDEVAETAAFLLVPVGAPSPARRS